VRGALRRHHAVGGGGARSDRARDQALAVALVGAIAGGLVAPLWERLQARTAERRIAPEGAPTCVSRQRPAAAAASRQAVPAADPRRRLARTGTSAHRCRRSPRARPGG